MTAAVAIEVSLAAGTPGLDVVRRFGVRSIDGVRKGLARGMKLAESEAARSLRGDVLRARSGVLARSVFGFVREDSSGFPTGVLGVRKGLADKYARIMEVGTVGAGGLLPDVVPVRARALAVPLPAALDRRGVPLYTGPRDPRIASQIYLIRRKGMPPLLARNVNTKAIRVNKRTGEVRAGQSLGVNFFGDRVEPLFVLLPRTVVKPRRYLRGAVERTLPTILRSVADAVAKSIVSDGGGR